MDAIEVSVSVDAKVPIPHAQHIASEFLEWLDNQGYTITAKHQAPPDERDFEHLARDFIRQW